MFYKKSVRNSKSVFGKILKSLPIETLAGTDFGSIHIVNPPSITIIIAGKYDWKNTDIKYLICDKRGGAKVAPESIVVRSIGAREQFS